MKSVHDWQLHVDAAYWRCLGYTQVETAKRVHRTWKTIQRWESDPRWHDAMAEAKKRYLGDAFAAARQAVIKQIRGGDGDLGFKLLERSEEGFMLQQKSQEDVVSQMIVQVLEAREQIERQLTTIAQRHAEFATNGHSSTDQKSG